MANAAQLKERARSLEQKSQWKPALEIYERLLADSETEEIGLWNRVGDLYLRLGEPHRAVEAYERGVDAYAEVGLHNNAIALCNKILRTLPERTSVYRRLAQFSAAQGFTADARGYFLKYAERMRKLGHVDEAIESMRDAARQMPEDVDLRRQVAEHLRVLGRNEAAAEELLTLLSEAEARADTALATELRAQIHAIDPHALPDPIPPTSAAPAPPAPERRPPSFRAGEAATRPQSDAGSTGSAGGELGIERSPSLEDRDLGPVGSLEGFERTHHREERPLGRDEVTDTSAGADLQLESFGPLDEEAAGNAAAKTEPLPLIARDDIWTHDLPAGGGGSLLSGEVDPPGGDALPLERLHESEERRRGPASDAGGGASRGQGSDPLAFLDLAGLDLASAARRESQAAAGRATPGTRPEAAEQPEGSANHFELGMAFKQMGLIDEAIAELQAALREGAEPLPTLEALGECFFVLGQLTLAARVLERALRVGATENQLVGVYYWLARCEEALGRTGAARDHFERVISHDIRYRDASARLHNLPDSDDSLPR